MSDDFQAPEPGDVDYGAVCHVCHQHTEGSSYAVDEDDRTWCVPCMLAWELKHGCHWETGQPIRKETK